ncbi:beta-lactamase family protein [Amphibacillus sp. MSJ-3]|uniref:serine hydrolase domain-containing protein n=1 Tax=Amphibacillus sp. MSJ-3 TaxID=2841505 RepID=UPI001C0F0AD9|nr:serine hydrolase [Amphibacillus sp. MSJ-3]MBU5594839.1 beta-lactamase family protein [Amphibacillus sp. MSJ-3]
MIKNISDIQKKNHFSGTIFVKTTQGVLVDGSYGYANRSERLENNSSTRYGIASGCKLFTAIAICQLIEQGKLSFDAKLRDCLEYDFPNFDKEITVHHLLTHTSGIPDYFDEEEMDDFEQLWMMMPMYHIRQLEDFLPLFQKAPMKLALAERFHYNNAGYILLGLIIERVYRDSFSNYVEEHIFKRAGMDRSGYFEFDQLPDNTAQGYINLSDGKWKTNIYSLPVKGGSDGGAFVTVSDMAKLWDCLMRHQLLGKAYTQRLLQDQVRVNGDSYYGYGVWIEKKNDVIVKYHIMGYDPGVSFHSAFYPETETSIVVCSNESEGAYEIFQELEAQVNRLNKNY